MSQSDVEQVRSLIGDEAYARIVSEGIRDGHSEIETVAYRSKEMVFLQDLNSSSYSSGEIRFDTFSARGQTKCWSDATLALDVQLYASTGAGYTGAEQLAFNFSSIGSIFGVRIGMSSGTTIVNNTSGSVFYDNLQRILTEKDNVWLQSAASEIHFEKATGNDSLGLSTPHLYYAASASAGSPTSPFVGIAPYAPGGTSFVSASSETGGIDLGFLKRCALFQRAFTFVPTTTAVAATSTTAAVPAYGYYAGKIFIPLHYLSDLWAKMSFPMINDQFLVSFFTTFTIQNKPANPSGSAVVPMVGQPQAQVWQVGTGTALPSVVFNSACRLYYDKLTLAPAVLSEFNKQLNSGMMRKVWFKDVESVQPQTINTPQYAFNTNVIQNCIRPHRLYVLRFPTQSIQAGTSSYLLQCPGTAWGSVQISINNSNWLAQPLTDPNQIWEYNKLCLPQTYEGSCSLLSWKDYLGGYDQLMFDLSKLKNSLSTENSQVSVINNTPLQGAGAAPYVPSSSNSITLVNVVEVERCCLFNISNTAIVLTVGSNNLA